MARKVKSKTAEAVDSGSRWKRGQRRAQRTMESPRNETPTQGRFAPLNGAPDLQIIDLTRVTWATRHGSSETPRTKKQRQRLSATFALVRNPDLNEHLV